MTEIQKVKILKVKTKAQREIKQFDSIRLTINKPLICPRTGTGCSGKTLSIRLPIVRLVKLGKCCAWFIPAVKILR